MRISCTLVLVAFLSVAVSSLEVRSQKVAGPNDILPPPRSDLVPVHWPDLTKLEADVREQLVSLQSSLLATVKTNSSAATLGNAYGTMGEIFHAYSLNAPARECYLNATRLAPKEFRWVYLLGKLDEQEGRFNHAISQYQLALALRPDYEAVLVNLGNIYLQLDRIEEAAKNFSAALVIYQSDAAALYGLGQISLSQRNYTRAVSYFEKALTLLPAATRIHYSLAMAYRGLGDLEEAAVHLSKQGSVGVRVNDPVFDGLQELIRSERIHLIRGKQALESQRYEEAREEFRKAIEINPKSITAHVNLGAALVETGNLAAAVEEYEEALRLDTININAHFNLAILLSKAGKHEAAIAHLHSVLSLDSKDLVSRLFLARELVKSDHLDEALVEFSRVLQAEPDNETVRLEQVKVLQLRGQYKQALESLEAAHSRNPNKGQTVAMLAYLLATSPVVELRNGERALGMAQLLYQQTGALEHGELVGMALAEIGRCGEAVELQRRLIAVAEREQKADLLIQLKARLNQYEKGPPCRPRSDSASPGIPK